MADAKCAVSKDDEVDCKSTMASGDTVASAAAPHHVRRKKKKILPGSAVILRPPPPPPPPPSGSGCASCPNCYLGHSCDHQPLPAFPGKGHDLPLQSPPLQPQARMRYV